MGVKTSKHHKILLVLYALVLVLTALGGFVLLNLSGQCVNIVADSGISCAAAIALSISFPLLLGGLPIFFLRHQSATTTRLLWAYSIFIAIFWIPLGTALGVYTMYYLRMRDREHEYQTRVDSESKASHDLN